MERLTIKFPNGYLLQEPKTEDGALEYINAIGEKLGKYEDAEEQGLLLKLPCKVGDTVYYPWIYDGQSCVALNEVESINIYYNRLPIITVKDWESDMCMAKTFTIEDFGKTVFLTKERAEESLQWLQSEVEE